VVEVLKGIHSIDFSEASNHGMELWILNCNDGVILIDTGMRELALQKIESELKSIGKNWKDITKVLITHKHGDHISNLAKIKEITKAEILSHKNEAPLIKEVTGVEVTGLEHGYKINQCGGIEIIHIPGHSEGNACYYLNERKILIAGDTVFGDENCNLTAPPEKYCLDVNQATKEIERLLNYDFDVLMYTHGKDIMENAKTHVKRLVQKTR
jgi:glyoxylase-like metal-dependent hydrolase (beta-lactamase superfamily II)